jgi:hypothetical protein
MLDLPTEPTASIPHYRYRETAFAVGEPDDPLLNPWPFLLIVRTERIFTVHVTTISDGCDTNEYRQIHGVSSI